ncbi:MAG: molybdopterin dinucleotide binding domain-containing protein [Candidatus Bathyarchaeia archaeon]|nr:molybdopterin dinucleotide-binding protein [Candidatus Bathyarchaeota archaeon]
MKVKLITGRSLQQGVGKEAGKFSQEYFNNVAICELDPNDMEALNISPGENVMVKTKFGEVVLKAVKSAHSPHKGIIFIPYGPWANLVIDPETHGSGMPNFKGIEAEVFPAKGEKILTLIEVLEKISGGK